MRPHPNASRHLMGPFDVIGDVHGCAAELDQLLHRLGYGADGGRHPAGRTAVFVGDLVDRGPDTPGVLRRVMGMVTSGAALAVCGNHDDRLRRHLAGRQVNLTHGLAESVAQLAAAPPDFVAAVSEFLAGLPRHMLLAEGDLVVAHAGLPEALQGVDSGKSAAFALYGGPTGEVDDHGFPIRADWAAAYRGRAAVVYGHTPVVAPAWRHNTLNVDTGCVFGGHLTAVRMPERELVAVAAARAHADHAAFRPKEP